MTIFYIPNSTQHLNITIIKQQFMSLLKQKS